MQTENSADTLKIRNTSRIAMANLIAKMNEVSDCFQIL